MAIVFSAKFGGVTAQANNSQKFSTQNRIFAKDFSLERCLFQGSNGKAETFKAENFRDMRFCGYSFLHKNDITMTVVFVHTEGQKGL